MADSNNVTEIKMGPPLIIIEKLRRAFFLAQDGQSDIEQEILGLHGMSGRLYRHFVNNLVREFDNAHYLEIGSWAGSTLCSAISNNAVRATAIDNWSQFGGPRDQFDANVERFKTSKAYLNFIESDFRAVDYSALGPFDIYLFDGPHEYQDQYDGLALVQPALADTYVFIVDDWNFDDVRRGTKKAIADLNVEILYSIEIRSTLDGTHAVSAHENSDWHNGYFISVLRKAIATQP